MNNRLPPLSLGARILLLYELVSPFILLRTFRTRNAFVWGTFTRLSQGYLPAYA